MCACEEATGECRESKSFNRSKCIAATSLHSHKPNFTTSKNLFHERTLHVITQVIVTYRIILFGEHSHSERQLVHHPTYTQRGATVPTVQTLISNGALCNTRRQHPSYSPRTRVPDSTFLTFDPRTSTLRWHCGHCTKRGLAPLSCPSPLPNISSPRPSSSCREAALR